MGDRFMLLRFSAADKFAFEQRPLPTIASQQHCKSAALDRRENTKLKSILRRIWNRLNRYFRSKRQTLKRWMNFKSILLSRKMQVSWQRGDSSEFFSPFPPKPTVARPLLIEVSRQRGEPSEFFSPLPLARPAPALPILSFTDRNVMAAGRVFGIFSPFAARQRSDSSECPGQAR